MNKFNNMMKVISESVGIMSNEEELQEIIMNIRDTRKGSIHNDDGTDEVKDDIDLSNLELNSLTELNLIINNIDGSFNCNNNNLTDLKGAPKHITKDFLCERNPLKSLEGFPTQVDGNVYISDLGRPFVGAKKITKGDILAVCKVDEKNVYVNEEDFAHGLNDLKKNGTFDN